MYEMLWINPVFCEVTTVDFEPKQRSYSKKTQQQRKLLVYTYNLIPRNQIVLSRGTQDSQNLSRQVCGRFSGRFMEIFF